MEHPIQKEERFVNELTKNKNNTLSVNMLKIPLNLAKRVLKNAGAKRISKDAQKELIKKLSEVSKQISILAIKNAEYKGRKTIKKQDIKKAIEEIESN